MPLEPSQALSGAWLALSISLALFLPGLVALQLAGHRSGHLERLALAPGLSTALWPLALLWTTLGGGHWSTAVVRLLTAAGVLAAPLVWYRRRGPLLAGGPQAAPTRWRLAGGLQLHGLALVAITVLATVGRIRQVQGIAVPPWVDGYHHTLITKLILEGGQVPGGLRPYLPIDRFFYHFGFHTLSAVVGWLAGIDAPAAVLWTGQALNVTALLSTYALATRLAGRTAGVAATAIPAALYYFPAYYTTWGRYTQLAGLVVLPTAWILVADALETRRRRVHLLAASAAAGLLLVHYRMFVFFCLGVLLVAAHRLPGSGSRPRWYRLGTVIVAAAVMAAPWVSRNLFLGVKGMSGASPQWYRAPPSVQEVPQWLFRVGHNEVWLVLGLVGLAVGLLRRRPAAMGLLAFGALATVAVYPQWLGLPITYFLPPFSLAISLYLPVAIGVALLVEGGLDLAPLLARGGGLRAPIAGPEHGGSQAGSVEPVSGGGEVAGPGAQLVLGAAVLLVALGVRRLPGIQPVTVIAQPADVLAARWVAANTSPTDCFLVGATHWHLNTYRGSDGGYWLPLLAERPTTMPAALYNWGPAEYARMVLEIARQAAKGDRLTDEELLGLMDRTGAGYVYVGPSQAGMGKELLARLERLPQLELVYSWEGVRIYRRRDRGRWAKPGAGSVVCRPVARAHRRAQ